LTHQGTFGGRFNRRKVVDAAIAGGFWGAVACHRFGLRQLAGGPGVGSELPHSIPGESGRRLWVSQVSHSPYLTTKCASTHRTVGLPPVQSERIAKPATPVFVPLVSGRRRSTAVWPYPPFPGIGETPTVRRGGQGGRNFPRKTHRHSQTLHVGDQRLCGGARRDRRVTAKAARPFLLPPTLHGGATLTEPCAIKKRRRENPGDLTRSVCPLWAGPYCRKLAYRRTWRGHPGHAPAAPASRRTTQARAGRRCHITGEVSGECLPAWR
jgi:hypothetical protein